MSTSNPVNQDPATAEATSPYNYVPTEWICITVGPHIPDMFGYCTEPVPSLAQFVMLFGINTVLHIFQSWKFRMWWLIPTVVVAGILEVLGWSARLWSSISPTLLTPFEIQYVTVFRYPFPLVNTPRLIGTILAPTPFLAANFLVLGKIIVRLGPQYSRLSPKLYALIFCTLDVICLTIQAVGGAYAADEVNRNQNPDKGGNIMLLGVTLQSCAMTLYVLCAGEFIQKRYAKIMEWEYRQMVDPRSGHPDVLPFRPVSGAFPFRRVLVACADIVDSATYRTVELSNGWSGPIISTQAYISACAINLFSPSTSFSTSLIPVADLDVFDGLMMTIALYTMNLIHPSFFLAETMLVAGGVDLPRHCSASTTCTTDSASLWT
ncbi:RTA1 like protein-domain-containing protein [Pisolithus sp. B1]|nr:RTA1 like protein-domain-containing protein [Pisolithus sp. B1]